MKKVPLICSIQQLLACNSVCETQLCTVSRKPTELLIHGSVVRSLLQARCKSSLTKMRANTPDW
jgi:hypothetical protein